MVENLDVNMEPNDKDILDDGAVVLGGMDGGAEEMTIGQIRELLADMEEGPEMQALKKKLEELESKQSQ